ncbi:MAG: hypothetical protein LRY54_03260 [Alphaproteobacteria bacterium]|nr:hypothetical protein [Alphaproteobacteria bacterium]
MLTGPSGLIWAADTPAEKAGQTSATAQNLLEQLEQESAKKKSAPAPSLPKIKDPLLDKEKKPLPYKNFSEIPEEAITEAIQVGKDCAADEMMSTYYDCECRAMRFLEARLQHGPLDNASTVMLDIQGECPNLPAIAGSAYNTCIHQGIAFFPAGQDPEEYCTCVGNSYAKLMGRSKRGYDSYMMVQMRTLATLSCTKQQPGVPAIAPPIP